MASKMTPSNSPYRPNMSKAMGYPTYGMHDPDAWRMGLRQVIGATILSPMAFDSVPASRTFVYAAGGIAVLVSLKDDLARSQRFFRARPDATPTTTFAPSFQSPGFRNATLATQKRLGTPLRETHIGTSPFATDWEDSPSSKTWTARERVKSVSCVSLSGDGRYLAVGEVDMRPQRCLVRTLTQSRPKTGYHPRVLVFSTAIDSPCDAPVAILLEHSHGVAAVAFSPDSRYIASLGTTQDGFLHMWTFNPRAGSAKLHSSSKCTSLVRTMLWTTKDLLITAGTRHVKLWRLEEPKSASPSKHRFPVEGRSQSVPASPGPQLLPGRNCLLGNLGDRTFTCAAPLPDGGTILCTDKGDVCMIELSEGNHRVHRVAKLEYGITSVTIGPSGKDAWLGARTGEIRSMVISEMISSRTSSPSSVAVSDSPTVAPQPCISAILGLAVMSDLLLVMDATHAPRILSLPEHDGVTSPGPVKSESAAHGGPVMGISILGKPSNSEAQFLTWTTEGQVYCWSGQGQRVDEWRIELEQPPTVDDEFRNELKVVRASPSNDVFVSGDRFGVLRILDGVSRTTKFEAKAHGADILDIDIYQDAHLTLVATCSRDRTVQLFQNMDDGWTLVQTFDSHKATVTGVMFVKDGTYLLSCAGDRTVAVRTLVTREQGSSLEAKYVPSRNLTLKSAPVSMARCTAVKQMAATPVPTSENIFVSTADRQLYEFDVDSGQCISSFRAVDTDSTDAVVLDKLVVFNSMNLSASSDHCLLIAGVSAMDKCIRVYDHRGNILCREWGHTEGVTGLALVSFDSVSGNATSGDDGAVKGVTRLVTTGADGTIMMWDVYRGQNPHQDGTGTGINGSSTDQGASKEMTVTKRPLRKVLSRTELAQFQKVATGSPSASSNDLRQARDSPRTLRKKMSRLANIATTNGAAASPAPKNMDHDDEAVSPTSISTPQGSWQRTTAASQSKTKTLAFRRSPLQHRRYRTKSTGNIPVERLQSHSHTRSSPSSRRESATNLTCSTEHLCQTLRTYRERLSSSQSLSSEMLDSKSSDELQRELQLTLQMLQRRSSMADRRNGRRCDDYGHGAAGNSRSFDGPKRPLEETRASHADNGINGASTKTADENKKAITEDHLVKLLTEYSERLVDLVDERITTVSGASSNNNNMRKRDDDKADITGDDVTPVSAPNGKAADLTLVAANGARTEGE